jgi:hypothetical protein
MRYSNGLFARCDLAPEFLGQGSLTDPGLPGYEHNLPLATQGALPYHVQLFDGSSAPHQCVLRRPARYDSVRTGGFRDRSDEPVSALGHGLNKARVLRVVAKCGAYSEDMSLNRLRLDHAVGPYGFEQLIVRDEAAGVLDQICEERKGFWP